MSSNNIMATHDTINKIEQECVFDFYSKTATHFSDTRHDTGQWPAIQKHVKEFLPGSLIFDAGCGNGKNMLIRDDLIWTGCDICQELLDICKTKGFPDVFRADLRDIQKPADTYDHTISIAVIHHIFEFNDRVKACQELVRVTVSGGTIFIQVWQNIGARNKKFYPVDDIMDADKGDYYVTWTGKDKTVSKRFYHMFDEAEVDRLVGSLDNIVLVDKFIEAKNWVIVLKKL
jgi:SAM-dependent methyltransferase